MNKNTNPIKMAEKLDDEIMNQLETILEKYEVASISKPKENHPKNIPMDFPNIKQCRSFYYGC